MGDLLHGQELIGVWFVRWRRLVVSANGGANGLEHVVSQMAKLVAHDVPQEVTQRRLDTENPGRFSDALAAPPFSAQTPDFSPETSLHDAPPLSNAFASTVFDSRASRC
jgi:hypothetical protein